MTDWTPTIDNCDEYLNSRTGKYEQRAIRYRHACNVMTDHGLTDDMTVIDVGAGWTEFDYTLRAEFGFKGRYIPVDGGIDGTDLNEWMPQRRADWFVALEIAEHLLEPYSFLGKMMLMADKGVVFSTPNPRTTDVFGMDPTHVSEVDGYVCQSLLGFRVMETTFYGGRFSNGQPDSLFGTWLKVGME